MLFLEVPLRHSLTQRCAGQRFKTSGHVGLGARIAHDALRAMGAPTRVRHVSSLLLHKSVDVTVQSGVIALTNASGDVSATNGRCGNAMRPSSEIAAQSRRSRDDSSVDPGDAINALEVTLRQLVRLVIGDNWRADVDVARLEERQTEERKRRDGSIVERDLLAFTHVHELRHVIEKHWPDFKPALHDRKRFDVYMDRVEDFRNAPMHSRTLLPFEVALLTGIVGEIRNEVTLYYSGRGPDMKHYPTVESIVDSFGNTAAIKSDAGGDGMTPTGLRLHVGQVVTFVGSGWDPHNRPLTWELLITNVAGDASLDTKVGSEVALTWRVEPSHVSESARVVIKVMSNGPYHRRGTYDFFHHFDYAVDPPD
ncbi:MAG: hypothetical protein JO214_10045 [Frankiaceae bacterium]|nr:hypothetical protein [Frankiaceae bacterium]